MRQVFHPFMPNAASGEPAVWIDVPNEGHSILLDAGFLHSVPNRKLQRTAQVIITHTHMDHFAGVDHLLRLNLRRETELKICGPEGFLRNMRGKIGAYTWNLIESYPLRVIAQELDGKTIRSTRFSGSERMEPEPLEDRPFHGTLLANRSYTVQAVVLDHGVPVLGVVLAEKEHLEVNGDRLAQLGLVPGPWLRELKMALHRAESLDVEVAAGTPHGGALRMTRRDLSREIIQRTPGQRIGYFTDFAFTPDNVERIREIAGGVDLMICESAFLHSDVDLARERRHITAHEAGGLAREIGAARLAPFHFSSRYQGREDELFAEAERAFGGPVVRLPSGNPVL